MCQAGAGNRNEENIVLILKVLASYGELLLNI